MYIGLAFPSLFLVRIGLVIASILRFLLLLSLPAGGEEGELDAQSVRVGGSRRVRGRRWGGRSFGW